VIETLLVPRTKFERRKDQVPGCLRGGPPKKRRAART